MRVLVSMSISVLIWSLYPLAATIGLTQSGGFELLVTAYTVATASSVVVTALYLYKYQLTGLTIKIFREMNFRSHRAAIVSGTAGALSHLFFFLSLGLANKGAVSVIFESWPIVAILLTPLIMNKAWKSFDYRDISAALLALAGIALVMTYGGDSGVTENSNNSVLLTFGGYLLALAGAFLCAVMAVAKGQCAIEFSHLNDDIGSCLVSEAISRFYSLILVLPGFLFFYGTYSLPTVHWGASIFIGFIVYVIGGALYTYAIINTDKPSIHVMYYFVPIASVVWLWLAGQATISFGIIVGGMLVLIANVYLAILHS